MLPLLISQPVDKLYNYDNHAVSLPEITPPLMDQVVGVGGSVNISCTAVSDDGMVTVSLTTTASNMAGLTTVAPTTTSLQLVNVMMDRADDYTCTATNARGPVTSTFHLYVVGEWACVCECKRVWACVWDVCVSVSVCGRECGCGCYSSYLMCLLIARAATGIVCLFAVIAHFAASVYSLHTTSY